MTHHSARAQWNTANARLANKPFDDLFADDKAPADLAPLFGSLSHMTPGYPFSLLAARRTAFLDAVHIQNVNSYLWDEEDGSDGVDVDTPPVSDEMDARNSRPYPY